MIFQTELPSEDAQLTQPRNTVQMQYIIAPSKHQGFDYSVTPESVLEDVNYSTQKNPTAWVVRKKKLKRFNIVTLKINFTKMFLLV